METEVKHKNTRPAQPGNMAGKTPATLNAMSLVTAGAQPGNPNVNVVVQPAAPAAYISI